jgi:hypothetical protein
MFGHTLELQKVAQDLLKVDTVGCGQRHIRGNQGGATFESIVIAFVEVEEDQHPGKFAEVSVDTLEG